jgi:hypothetical protein
MTADDANKMMQLWMNKVISYETLYENMQRGRIASEERTAEEEQELIAEEEAAALEAQQNMPGAGTDEYTDPTQDELNSFFADGGGDQSPGNQQPTPGQTPQPGGNAQ